MSKPKMYKCSFKHCAHVSPEVSGDIAVKVGKRYMHPDCAKISENINKTKELYYEKVSNTVVIPQLLNVINNIIFTKKVDSGYLYFALKYAINHKYNIKSPYSLHYIIDYQAIKNEWKKQQLKERQSRMEKVSEESAPETTFNWKASADDGFDAIFGG